MKPFSFSKSYVIAIDRDQFFMDESYDGKRSHLTDSMKYAQIYDSSIPSDMEQMYADASLLDEEGKHSYWIAEIVLDFKPANDP